MYIARTGGLVTTKDGLEQKFYILDENNSYELIKSVKLNFPFGTIQDDIDTTIAQVIKDSYELKVSPSPNTLAEIKTAAIQPMNQDVVKFQDKLNGISQSTSQIRH